MENKRSYAKESFKSKPSGIRFNIEQEKIALMRSRKKTRQQLVDFLLENYVKGENPITERLSEKQNNTPTFNPPIQHEIKKSVTEWVEEKREILLPEQYQEFIDRLNKVKYLTDKQKSEIKYA